MRTEPYSPRASRAYVEGLLPSGPRRRRIARQLELDPADGYALIAALGRDCPGAVAFVPRGEEPAPARGGPISWLDENELAEALPAPSSLRGTARRAEATLAGDRHKLSLLRGDRDGRWALPERGRPGTHIVKPETGEHPEIAVNEMFCMAVLRQAGLPAARTSIETIAGQRCLVSPRFDQVWEGAAPRRLHQETFCQALGIAPAAGAGSEDADADAPGFAEAAGLLRAVGRGREVTTLVHAAFCNYVLGNGDAHGSHFALLFRDDGVQLAPLYGVTSTLVYDRHVASGMVLPDHRDPDAYLRELGHVAEELGIGAEIFQIQATCALSYVCDAIEVVADRAEDDGWYGPIIDEIFELAHERATRCAERLLLWDFDR